MAIVSSTFGALGSSTALVVKKGDTVKFSISGTFVASVLMEYSDNAGQTWYTFKKYTAAASGLVQVDFSGFKDGLLRLRCDDYTSGTVTYSIQSLVAGFTTVFNVSKGSKVGATAGWSVGAAADTSVVTLPASQTASTLVMPVHFDSGVGKKILGFYLVGQIESGGNAVTLDCALKRHNPEAADVTTTTVASMTQISVTADTALTDSNTITDVREEVIDKNATYFFLVTGTTLGSTDVALQGIGVLFSE